jgi:peptide-methionine (S)-S-oxide reductase
VDSVAIYIVIITAITTAITAAATAATSTMMPNLVSRLFRPFTTSTQMSVIPSSTATTAPASASTTTTTPATATFAAGCFWGVQHIFLKHFPSLLTTRVGYTSTASQQSPNQPTPNYALVCTSKTPHTEALQITYDPSQTSYRELVEFFFRMHDPTTKDRQGPDRGSQYRSAVFWHGDEQERVVRDVVARAGREWWKGKDIVTEIARKSFFPPFS